MELAAKLQLLNYIWNLRINCELISINKLRSRNPGYDEISFNVVKKCFGELYDPLKFIFEL